MENKLSEVMPGNSEKASESRFVPIRFPSWFVPVTLLLACTYPYVGEQLVTACAEIFYPPPHGKMFPPPEYLTAVTHAMTINTAIGYGLCGALFFLLLGIVIGATKGAGYILRGALFGAIVGLLLTGAAAWLGRQIENNLLQEDIDGMLRAALVLSTVFVAYALAGGLVVRLGGLRRIAIGRTLGLSIVMGLLGITAYILIAAIFIPMGWIEGMHPTEMSIRYLYFTCLNLSAVFSTYASLGSLSSEASPAVA